ncbi:hypothetical protein NFI96_004617 [Prochilodus magdalenae]|nr:hypothetical protein NFI96_004617 [Prochilodus magdalenae]
MVTKLSSCQYALPLLVPSPTSTDIELPLWTFRQIKKTWKLSSVSSSKSQLLNSLINPKHDTFFHRDSPGSSRTRLFMEGLVEIAWYCPAGNTDDLFRREMGQIYEAWATEPEEMGAKVSVFTAVAADLLISGHPLELMDGDAAHVPLTWIESVLDKVTETLGDQRVFVLSVLGLQSSGKSTMLNAMFGLQFAVSAGRCTRGAFMQLIRVKEEDKEKLKFDYLLVVDTGGLRSLEQGLKSSYNHVNELVTFVTDLANMILINILGENPAEIKGTLHVIIQAIIRMKEVKLDPSCMFVHQNITDITTAEKNMERRLHLQEKLDKMTRSVAKEQDCDVKCFSELVQFNIQTDVHYFAQLWEGNPPMPPPNPRYSENVESLKQAVLTAAAGKKCLRLSELKVRIRDLWTAVLSEDFVFSSKRPGDHSIQLLGYRYRAEYVTSGGTCEHWSFYSEQLHYQNRTLCIYNRTEPLGECCPQGSKELAEFRLSWTGLDWPVFGQELKKRTTGDRGRKGKRE